MVKNCQIFYIFLQKKVMSWFWATRFGNFRSEKWRFGCVSQNLARTFFWRKISTIWQFSTIEFYLTFTHKKIWGVSVCSDCWKLWPKKFDSETENLEVSCKSCTTDLRFPGFSRNPSIFETPYLRAQEELEAHWQTLGGSQIYMETLRNENTFCLWYVVGPFVIEKQYFGSRFFSLIKWCFEVSNFLVGTGYCILY